VAHTALARKYRPRSFEDVAVQEHVSETLRRAVAGNRVSHAYLFCGPRGVGKTTLARVLAMALNCPNRTEDGEPCGTCRSCDRIWGGHTALDVVEIDAASNRGVDDARDLRERAMYAPSEEERYKVYIVDEAHMLTREAWNALLKILEEPPPRVIFVFATTEPQKIQQSAAPILSRCQRFDFRRVGVSDVVRRLHDVLEGESASAPEEALRIIGRKADGGMRDALSLLDQVLSLSGGDVELEAVRRVLGLVEEERYLGLLDILVEGRHGDVFTVVERLLDDGYDLVEFYHGLLDVLRSLLRLRLTPDATLDVRPDIRDRLAERARSFEPADLVRMLAAAAELESSGTLARSPNPRILVEMLLLRLSYMDRTVALAYLIRALGGAPPSEGGAASGGGGVGPPSGGPDGADGGSPSPAGGEGGAGGVRNAPPPPSGASSSPASGTRPGPVASSRAPVTNGPAGRGRGIAVDEAPAPTPSPARRHPRNGRGGDGAGDSGPETAFTGAPSGTGTAATGAPGLQGAWNRWVEEGRDLPRGLSSFLRTASVREVDGGAVEVAVASAACERASQPEARARMERGLARHLGRDVYVRIAEVAAPAEAGGRITEETVRGDRLRELHRKEPRLRRAVEELDLELLD
jgi:DNA polymerase-3 subunit gamma/tau